MLEKEVKEKALLIGKLRHEGPLAVIDKGSDVHSAEITFSHYSERAPYGSYPPITKRRLGYQCR